MKQSTALKFMIIFAANLLAAPAFATDGSDTDTSALAKWEADPTLIFEASDIDLADFKWLARPVIVFADAAADPSFGQQMDLLAARTHELVIRDVVLVTDTDPAAKGDIRRKFRPRGFMLTLVGKDGRVMLRKPFPWDVRELTRSIDKQPIRRQELKDQFGSVQ